MCRVVKLRIAIINTQKQPIGRLIQALRIDPNIEVSSYSTNDSTPDVILLNLRSLSDLPNDLINSEKANVSLKTVIVSDQLGIYDLAASLSKGIAAILSQDEDVEAFYDAFHIIKKGGMYISPGITGKLDELNNRKNHSRRLTFLSTSEHQVLQHICDGLSSRESGRLLNRSHRTIEEYRKNLYTKFQVRSKAQLIIKATTLNIVSPVLDQET
jgi:DNA-binding NarL/FixJ family response regulator